MSGNKNDKILWSQNICQEPCPHDKNWICSLKAKHKSDHAAYYLHDTTMRSRLGKRWANIGGSGTAAHQDDVAAALASIQQTLASRLPADGGPVRTVVQTPRERLTAIIDDLTALRDALP